MNRKTNTMEMKTSSTKQFVMILIATLLFATLANSVLAQTTAEKISRSSNLLVTFVNQEPDPVEPGDSVDVRFKVENIGGDDAADVEFEVVPEFPFGLEPGESAKRNLGTLQSRQIDEEGVIVKYSLLVDDDAVEGDHVILIKYRTKNDAWVSTDNFTIEVRTRDAILAIENVTTDKKTLEPGTTNRVTLSIENQADSLLRNIQIRLDLEGTPLVPIGSGNERSIYQIQAKTSQDVPFSLLVDPEAESGVYKVPVKLTYTDQVGTQFIKNNTIGLIVGAEPDLSVTLDDSTIYRAGQTGDISVKVVNKGVSNIKFTNVKLLGSERFRLLSTSEIYLGNIDSDDFESATFKLFIEDTSGGQILLPLQLEYKDANNNAFTKKIDLPINLYSSSEAKKFGLQQGSGKVGIIIVIIIVVVGIFIFRRYWKKRKH